ncbi:hypothetical protein BWZ20_09295 [Winogradskyella sp. J14-2]|uniref:hypothetical protein n=1 Tax=Winogradskyella sp. J14-2 TaxID=1936080 RepID=UPI000972BE21|nr:hypothetical protein [Winogradskyella sp. J14-2]APY08481.1 hypothetical protein BWZ20_09295 [Winogradskyella sp. J14-2]
MKLLFIENRYKTYFFEPIAHRLKSEGHDIYWIIQNREFSPSESSNTYFIDYPKGRFDYEKAEHVEKVIISDRQINHFNQKDTSYFYYYDKKINELLNAIQPDLVFGESTAFHELLTIENCKKRNILYLNPSTCRYPVGRFSFYKYDTLEPFSGSGEVLETNEALGIVNQIVNRETAPNYMVPVTTSKTTLLKDKIKKTLTYYKGEIYNTPNPITKYKLEKNKKKNIIRWDKNALTSIESSSTIKLLYPLQMQPEANIDVWGRPYRNQLKLIKDLSLALPSNAQLYVKPNPKSKYELGKDLIHFVEQTNNIKALHHSTKMDDVLPVMDLVITVTGTIAIECVLSNTPVVSLVNTINTKANNCKFVTDIKSELPHIIKIVSEDTFPKISDEEKIAYINLLNQTSFKGIVSDPLSDVGCVSEENINDMFVAFSTLLNDYKCN